jgi:hypothetical protein
MSALEFVCSTYVQPHDSWAFVRQQAEKFKACQDTCSIDSFPHELILSILALISAKELACCSCVCKKWKVLASNSALWNQYDLRKIFPKLNIIDDNIWNRCIDLKAFDLQVSDLAPLDQHKTILQLKKLFNVKVENDAGFTLLTIPKGLTINKLIEIAKSPKQGSATRFHYICQEILKHFGDMKVENTYRIMISNSILKGTRDQPVNSLQEMLSQIGCEIPRAIELATLCVLSYISALEFPPPRLYADRPCTYSYCFEKIEEASLLVGGYSLQRILSGINITINKYKLHEDAYGAGAAKKV